MACRSARGEDRATGEDPGSGDDRPWGEMCAWGVLRVPKSDYGEVLRGEARLGQRLGSAMKVAAWSKPGG